MSTILQALQRAQAERRPGDPPGADLTAVLGPPPTPSPAARSDRTRSGLWVAVGTTGVVLALAVGWWLGRGASRDPSSITASSGPTTAPAARSPQVVDGPPVVPQAPAAATDAAAESTSPPPSRMPPPALIPEAPAAAPAGSPPTPNPPVAKPAELKPREQLPAALQSGLPPLRIGGAIGAERAADRMLLVDGRVLREGDAVVPGLVLLSIGARQAVFGWRDQRFTVAY